MREQEPHFSNMHYERPNQPRHCGLASEGPPCPAGPTAHGQCPALAECAPRRDGDRWQCNRSPLRGGPCEHGPLPDGACGRVNHCHPERSLRAMRGRFVTACAVLAVGAMLVTLNSDWRNRVIAPGPLTRGHAQIVANEPSPDPSLQGRGNASCAACHPAGERSFGGWTLALASIGTGSHESQSQRCMECHSKTIPATLALAPHNVPPELLRQITGLPALASVKSIQQFECSACHREHHGANFNLTAMSNTACQSCHRQQYTSFVGNHPDFSAWPYERPTGITFNHASHQAKHFTQKNQKFECSQCHVSDSTGRAQLTTNYATACASCHDEKIATSVAQGVPMLALPTMDVDALKEAGHDIGAWPEAATGDFDGQLPPAMKLLLAGDPEAKKAIDELGADFEFIDVDPDDPKQLAASATIAAAIKRLLTDLSERGPAAVRERLSAVTGHDVQTAEVRELVAGLSPQLVRETQATWFGEAEASKSTASTKPAEMASFASVGSNREQLVLDPAGDWSRDDASFTLRYRPVAHADPILTSWLQLLATTPDLSQRSVPLAMFKKLSQPTAAGQCTSCHSSTPAADGRMAMHWQTYEPSSAPRGFTKFSHGPHLEVSHLANCTQCHAINDSAGDTTVSAAAATQSPHDASGFKPLRKAQCAQCHTAMAAGSACQQCHNYHVEEIADLELWIRGSGIRENSGAVVHARKSHEFRYESEIRNPRSEIAKTSTDTQPERR